MAGVAVAWIQAIALMVAKLHIICKSFVVWQAEPLGRPASI